MAEDDSSSSEDVAATYAIVNEKFERIGSRLVLRSSGSQPESSQGKGKRKMRDDDEYVTSLFSMYCNHVIISLING